MTDEVKEIAADLDDTMVAELEARGRGRQAAARRALRRRLPRPRRRVARGRRRHLAACTSSTSTPAPRSAATRWRGSERWPPPPSAAAGRAPGPRAKPRRKVRFNGETQDSDAVPAAGLHRLRRLLRLSRAARLLPELHRLRPAQNDGSWVGLDNYKALLQDTLFWNALWITLKYVSSTSASRRSWRWRSPC